MKCLFPKQEKLRKDGGLERQSNLWSRFDCNTFFIKLSIVCTSLSLYLTHSYTL